MLLSFVMKVFEARKKLRTESIEFVDKYQRFGVFQLVKEKLTKKRTKIRISFIEQSQVY